MSASDAPKLYASREPVFPRRVSGFFRRMKWWIMGVTLGIYYLLPWIRWDRGPEMPNQAVLLDLADRRFFFFWIEIWPHEFYFVAGLLVMAGLGLFLFTSALGRVWCGYACPQTVWTDLFILTERWIDGDRNARIRLWNAPWSAKKVRLRVTKYIVWALIGLATGGAWIFYFADAPTLAVDLVTGQAHPVAYTTMAILTFTTVFMGGVAREQVCIYACPWPRIQAAMMDESTITIGYRDWRGEPRGKGNVKRRSAAKAEAAARVSQAAGEPAGRQYPPTPYPGHENKLGAWPSPDPAVARGDCIDCMACVNVCPMGIDIRNGQQMECITCGLCIDACDEVMGKIGKPRGLIDYFALQDEQVERAGGTPTKIWKHIFRPRTIVYTSLWSLIGAALIFALFMQPDIDLTVAPVRNPVYVQMADGTVRNAYEIRVRNKHGEARPFRITLSGDPMLYLDVEGTPYETVTVPADSMALERVYVMAPPGSEQAEAARTGFRFWVTDLTNGDRTYEDSHFNGLGR
ncbi:RdxA/RdxB/FixG family protein [Histidinibacterium aquaticum]|uniref:Cytochrome c oxidase accessory protein CcoG n=1 Tax=Histidinibacterium aquaticum TaxID=2613962 RepID=A0A5J5GDP1_9RHOB|nr:cytochrome c oxidase accessory protein CcoG [Histidinibacterium aquaticum]KAA9006080.1 cytochrome c oxidase accessory protein CcoG [Histidinibacterium aquaticum]